MSISRVSAAPARRAIAAVVAAALALFGIAFAPAAQAATTTPPVATITPTSVSPGQAATYTVSVTGGSVDKLATVDIRVPAGFSTVGSPTYSLPTSSWSASYTSTNQTFHFVAPSNNSKLDNTQTITVTIQAQAPTVSGSYVWPTTATSNTGGGGPITIAPQPTVTVNNPAQAITFAALTDMTFGDADRTVSATGGGSGNPVTFSASGACTSGGANGATIHLTGAGSCSVNADQAAGSGYAAAPTVTRSFTINKAPQAITFAALDTKTFNDAPFGLSATSSAGLPVSYGASGACSVSGGTVTITGAGSCTITADQAGNANYTAAPQQARTFTINKAGAVLSLTDLTYGYDGAAHHATAATVPAGLAGVTVTYSRDGSPVSNPTAAGSYAVTAELANADYAAERVTGTLVINPRHITGGFTAADKTYDGSTAANVLTRTLTGAVAGDDVHLTGGSAAFGSKDAGSRVATLAGATLTGGAAANYVLDGVGTATATIGKADVTAAIIAGDKNYDGTDGAEITDKSLSGVLGSDDLGLDSGDAHFSQARVGSALPVHATITLTGAAKNDYQLTNTTAVTTANIWAAVLSGSFTVDSKPYDGTTTASARPSSLTGVVGNEDVSLVVGNAQFATSAAGANKTVTADLSLSGGGRDNYVLSSRTATATADISPKALTGGIVARGKVYDGTRAATADPGALAGIVGNDDVTLEVDAAAFDDRNVGAGKTVTAELSLSGADASNYLINSTATDQAAITAKALTGTITADDKGYDGTTDATAAPHLFGAVDHDDVTLGIDSAAFADRNVGAGKTVTAQLSLSGADAGNYTVNPTATDQADITTKTLTGTITADNKVYDGTTAATATPHLDGAASTDQVSLRVDSAAFGDKSVGNAKTVTAQLSLTGADAANYTVNPTATDHADISAKLLTGTITAHDKVYDGSTDANVDPHLDGAVASDNVTVGVDSAAFGDRNVGAGKTVTAQLSLTGADAGNYMINSTATAPADITPKALTGTITADDRAYDGTTAATVHPSLNGAVPNDDVTLGIASAAFGDKNVGTAKTVTAQLSLGGNDAGNYTINPTATTTASIGRLGLTGTITAHNKVYDGTTDASVDAHLVGAASTDQVSLRVDSAAFGDKSVGNAKTVTAQLSLTGADAANYTVNPTATDHADISAKLLTGTITAHDKVYDGSTDANVDPHLDGAVASDNVTVGVDSAAFGDRNVGAGKTVTAELSLSGADAGNYMINSTATDQAAISAKSLTGTITADDKTYDGTTAATATPHLDGAVPTDDVTLGVDSAAFGDRNVGAGKTVTAQLSLHGADAGNYTVNTAATDQAAITVKALTGTITADNKVYDGTTAATATPHLDGAVPTDDVTLGVDSSAFGDKNVGTGKTVTAHLSLHGADAHNYTVNPAATDQAAISAKLLTGTITAHDKTYDGSTDASVDPHLDGAVANDDVTLGASGSFGDRNVGAGKTVTAELSLSGADARNYMINSTATDQAAITAKALTGTITADDKTYDGNAVATVHPSLDGAVPHDDVTLGANGAFADNTAGSGKTVTAQLSLGGNDAGNYTINPTATTTASIGRLGLTGTITADDKTYDGNAGAVAHPHLDGVVARDDVTPGADSAAFGDKNVGTGKTVTAQLSLHGIDASNYTVNPTASTLAAITAKVLTGTITADDKTYDGNAVATVHPSLDGAVPNDDVNLGASGSFADKTAGSGKTVTAQLTLGGNDAHNYTINPTATTTASIGRLGLTGTITADDKTYDGNSSALVHPHLDGAVTADRVTLGATGSFANKDAGSNKTVTAQLALTGADAANYTVNPTASTTASISRLGLTGTITADNKVYDGSTAATVHPSLSGAVPNDDVTLGGFGSFADKNAGTAKTVTAQLSLSGVDARNYTVNDRATAPASITVRTVTGSFTAAGKVWDGTTAATITSRILSGAVPNDDVSLVGGSATFDSAAVGSQTVHGTGFGLGGADAGNYALALPVQPTSATITALYSGKGFYTPIDMTTPTGALIWNTIKGGQTVPLKFEIFDAHSGVEQSSLSAFGPDATSQAAAFKATPVSCSTANATSDPVEVTTTGGTALRYDATGGQFIQNWKTPTTVGSCYSVTVRTVDGTAVGPAYFKITK